MHQRHPHSSRSLSASSCLSIMMRSSKTHVIPVRGQKPGGAWLLPQPRLIACLLPCGINRVEPKSAACKKERQKCGKNRWQIKLGACWCQHPRSPLRGTPSRRAKILRTPAAVSFLGRKAGTSQHCIDRFLLTPSVRISQRRL